MWCTIVYILLNMVQSQFSCYTSGIFRTRTFIPEETERTGGYKAFFLQMIWLILIAIDLMFFLFQRLQKQSLRSLPLIGGNVLILIFIGPESDHWLCLSVTNSLTHSLLFSKLDWCDPGVWRCQLKTCWGCYCCWCWWWGTCWQQLVADLEAEVWS